MNKGLYGAAVLLACSLAASGGVIVGLPNEDGNCFPFGCSGTRYQQMYAAAQFPGPITISDITFYLSSGSGTFAPGTYTFYLSTSPLTVSTMSTSDFAANIGADNALFAAVPLSGAVSGSFTVSGVPFSYDPASGDLLLDIFAAQSGSGSLFLDARIGSGGGIVSRYHDFGTGFAGYGLVTGFNAGSPEVIPEPGTWVMAAAGLGLLAFRRRK